MFGLCSLCEIVRRYMFVVIVLYVRCCEDMLVYVRVEPCHMLNSAKQLSVVVVRLTVVLRRCLAITERYKRASVRNC